MSDSTSHDARSAETPKPETPAPPSTPAPRLLTVQKGATKTALKLDTTMPLAALRRTLVDRGLMNASDWFETAGGGRVMPADENGLTAADVIGTTTTILVASPDPGTRAITIVRRSVEKVHRIPEDSTLAALRLVLSAEGGIGDGEGFVDQGGRAAVPRHREAAVLALDAVIDNKLAIVPLTWG